MFKGMLNYWQRELAARCMVRDKLSSANFKTGAVQISFLLY